MHRASPHDLNPRNVSRDGRISARNLHVAINRPCPDFIICLPRQVIPTVELLQPSIRIYDLVNNFGNVEKIFNQTWIIRRVFLKNNIHHIFYESAKEKNDVS